MTLPFYRADEDPGPSFAEVLRRSGRAQSWGDLPRDVRIDAPHGTTVVAIGLVEEDGEARLAARRRRDRAPERHGLPERDAPGARHVHEQTGRQQDRGS